MICSTAKFGDRIRRAAARMRANSRAGNAMIEFAFVAPVFFLLLFGIIETGVIFFAQSTLQYAVNDVARYVRTGQASNAAMTQAQFQTRICNDIAPLLACGANLQIDVESYTDFSTAGFASPLNGNGTLNAALSNYQLGAACSVVLVRVFYIWPVATPLLTSFLVNMANNSHLLYAAAAFRNEPYSTGVAGC